MRIGKSIKGLGLVTLCFIVFNATASAVFPDVSLDHQNYDAIRYAEEQGIIDGYADGSFRASQTINRAEFTKIVTIANNGGLPTQRTRACFSDIAGDEWFASTVCWAFGYGAIGGYPDGTFRPAETINFAEAAKIIVGIFAPNSMSPVPLYEPWYRPYVQYLGEQGAIPTTIMSFDQNITRGEMVEIIYRLDAKLKDKPSRKYEDYYGFSGWMSFVNTDIDVIFDCPVMTCSKATVAMGNDNSWVIYSNLRPILLELDAKQLAQQQLIIKSSRIISDYRTNQGGSKVIYELQQIGGANRQAIITCGMRTLLFPGVLIESEGEEAWDAVQRMIDNFKFTRC